MKENHALNFDMLGKVFSYKAKQYLGFGKLWGFSSLPPPH